MRMYIEVRFRSATIIALTDERLCFRMDELSQQMIAAEERMDKMLRFP